MKESLLIFIIFVITNLLRSQVPGLMWELVYEPQLSMAREIIRTNDSSYLVTATNSSFDDGLTLKIDSLGNVIWASDYGGFAIVQTMDGNYIIAGGGDIIMLFYVRLIHSGIYYGPKAMAQADNMTYFLSYNVPIRA